MSKKTQRTSKNFKLETSVTLKVQLHKLNHDFLHVNFRHVVS